MIFKFSEDSNILNLRFIRSRSAH